MTRFARAKGSKASNERVEQDATSWTEMKHQLEAKKDDIHYQSMHKEAEMKRQENYNKFLKDTEADESKKSAWSDFPQTITQNKKAKSTTNNQNNISKANKSKRLKSTIKDSTEEKLETNNNTEARAINRNEKVIKNKGEKRKLTTVDNQVKKGKSKKPKNTKEPMVLIPKKKIEEMTESERKKFEKSKNKKRKQWENRKLKKQQLKEAQISASTEDNSKDNKSVQFSKWTKIIKKMPPKAKKFDKEYKPRKNLETESQKVSINGKEIELVHFDGFPIKKEDAERLQSLRKQMISKGLPRSEVQAALKLERRRAEKSLARDKKNVCYNCRTAGHVLAECPSIGSTGDNMHTAVSGICYKCGSTEHAHFECKVVKYQEFRFASCFICKEQGHISWQCPDNAKGLYPKGGSCMLCGDVTHLKKDCPKHVAEQKANEISLDTLTDSGNPDLMDQGGSLTKATTLSSKPNKIIRF